MSSTDGQGSSRWRNQRHGAAFHPTGTRPVEDAEAAVLGHGAPPRAEQGDAAVGVEVVEHEGQHHAVEAGRRLSQSSASPIDERGSTAPGGGRRRASQPARRQPVTSAPGTTSTAVTCPVPQPSSSTRSPGPHVERVDEGPVAAPAAAPGQEDRRVDGVVDGVDGQLHSLKMLT